MKHKGCIGVLVLRLVIGAVFLYHGITKIMMPMSGMIDFVGGAATGMGLTFLSNETWFWIVAIAETLGGAMLVLGMATRWFAAILAIIMLFAINTKGWSMMASELDFVILGTLISLMFSGAKRYSLDAALCKTTMDTSDLHSHHHHG